MISLFITQKENNFKELITRCKTLNLIFGNTNFRITYLNNNLNIKDLSIVKDIFKKYLKNAELEINI